MTIKKFDFVIIGSGAIGLFIAYQLKEKFEKSSVLIIEKEKQSGTHTSGRNSGVLHAGIYYEPNSLKAKVCQSGANRLKMWIEANSLPLNKCGKVIVPQDSNLDKQIDILVERASANNVDVELWNEKELRTFFPEARSASGRALWSPNTCVTNPKKVIEQLVKDLEDKGVEFSYEAKISKYPSNNNRIELNNVTQIDFGYLFNCAGLYAVEIAQKFDVGLEFKVIPFKGSYWQLKKNCQLDIPSNLYPVPDLDLPFLGIHFTPSAEASPRIYIGPTANIALGRENYKLTEGIEPLHLAQNIATLGTQYISNNGKFRKYFHEQSPQAFKPFMIKHAKKLIPNLRNEHIEKSSKVGIRAQLYCMKKEKLIQDFICIKKENTMHVLNGISPAFTASFELADLIINKSSL